MKLMMQVSADRVREKDGVHFTDFYLVWSYEGHTYSVRIRPQFPRDYNKLFALADEIPAGELLEKYL